MDSKVLKLGQINFEIDKESDKLMPSETLFGDLTVKLSSHLYINHTSAKS